MSSENMESEVQDDSSASGKKGKTKNCCRSCWKWIGSPSFYIYLNFFLSQWGDWMWQFAVGLFLVHLSNGQLLLAAIYGFSGGGCVLLFGGIIGDWVDRNGRLKVIRVSLFVQNMSVMLSAICICVIVALEVNVAGLQYGQVGRRLMEMATIALAVSAMLANVAYTIAIEKDWIVVIAQEKSSDLANLNAGTRTLGLVCKILSPTAAGFIMSYGSLLICAIVIAAWNLVSVFIEYAILSHVFRMVPRLSIKKGGVPEQDTELAVVQSELEPMTKVINADGKHSTDNNQNNGISLPQEPEDELKEKIANEEKSEDNEVEIKSPDDSSCIRKVLEPFIVLVRGWHTYATQTVVYAGVSLAFLYMTVLGFDSITVGYIYANGVSESLVGICMALGGVTGICGTLLFPCLRRRFGLETTGLVAFTAEISCLVLAVLSVWAPGSRFDPYFVSRSSENSEHSETNNCTSNAPSQNLSSEVHNSTEVTGCSAVKSYFSIILLLVGIISSRVGLWMADLVVTQIMQESVLEKERGIVHGVQNSLNMLMDMLKFILVIVAPQIEIFGFHIIISFSFICMAGLFFVGHVVRIRKRKRMAKQNKTEQLSK